MQRVETKRMSERKVEGEFVDRSGKCPPWARRPEAIIIVATARVFDLKLVTADERLIDLKDVPRLANR